MPSCPRGREAVLSKVVDSIPPAAAVCADTVPMFTENRREPRVALALPLKVGDALEAVTRDISPSGLYFELHGAQLLEGTLNFEMVLEDANMKFTAQGTIVRVEHREGFTGVAVKLVAGRLEPIA
jgi:hypothetical protein